MEGVNEANVFSYIDLIGTFIFALSGTSIGIRKEFDIFGIFVLSAIAGCGGGIIRDLCIGAVPPAVLDNPIYLYTILLAVIVGILGQKFIIHLKKPTLYLDAIGLGFFAAFGAHKTWLITQDIHLSILLGCISGVGGGALRDILSGEPPAIFSREIYATAAILGASIELLGSTEHINPTLSMWAAIIVCSTIRILALRFDINLPTIRSYK